MISFHCLYRAFRKLLFLIFRFNVVLIIVLYIIIIFSFYSSFSACVTVRQESHARDELLEQRTWGEDDGKEDDGDDFMKVNASSYKDQGS